MAIFPFGLTSMEGRRIGITARDELVSGTRDAVVPMLEYVNVAASAAITGTSSETAFSTKCTIPPKALRVASRLRIRFQGIATATNGSDTLAIKLYIGGIAGTALLTLAARDVANNDLFAGDFELIVRTEGASGTFVGWGTAPANPNAAGTAMAMYSLGSTAIDTTAAQDIVVSATWSSNNAGNSCRLDLLSVEQA